MKPRQLVNQNKLTTVGPSSAALVSQEMQSPLNTLLKSCETQVKLV